MENQLRQGSGSPEKQQKPEPVPADSAQGLPKPGGMPVGTEIRMGNQGNGLGSVCHRGASFPEDVSSIFLSLCGSNRTGGE